MHMLRAVWWFKKVQKLKREQRKVWNGRNEAEEDESWRREENGNAWGSSST